MTKRKPQKLTVARVKGAAFEGQTRVNADGREVYDRDVRWDTEIRGLGLRVFPSGRKSFVYSYRAEGRKRLMALGDFGELTLDEARDRAKRRAVEVIDGKDPLLERQKTRAEGATFQDLIDRYMKDHAIGPRGKKHPRKKTWQTDEQRLQRHTPHQWRGRKVGAILHEDVAALHAKLGAKTPYEANRFIDLLSVMFRLALKWRMIPRAVGNPAEDVDKFKEHRRKRWGKPEELAAIAKAIDREPNVYIRGAIWMYILTGGRKREVLDASRANVDWQRGQLRLPDTKSGEEQYLTLSAPALAVLSALPIQADNPFLFPGKKKGRPLINISKGWGRVRDGGTVFLWADADPAAASLIDELESQLGRRPEAEAVEQAAKGRGIVLQGDIRDLTVHDLRRSTGSWMTQFGTDLNVIKKGLRHASLSTTLTYAELGADPAREAFEEHGQRILEVTGKRRPVEVMGGGDA